MKQCAYSCCREGKRDAIIPVYEKDTVCEAMGVHLEYDITALVDTSYGKVTIIHTLGKLPFAKLIFLGMGKREEMTSAKMREVFGRLPKYLKEPASLVVKHAVCEEVDLHQVTALFAESYTLSAYHEQRVGKENEPYADVDLIATEDISADIERGLAYAAGINFAKDLANTPANIMTPERLSAEAAEMAERYGIECRILDQKQLAQLGAGALLAVSQGSDQSPCMIVLRYQGDAPDAPYTALVGKGLTFDAGGYNIKSNSYGMKYDMCGGADVLGAMEIIAANRFKSNVIAIVPASENLINGSAYKPQDVITTMSGKTVEIANTDAEGRLILCDALTYAQKHMHNVTRIVDIATLTGACARALGGVYTGVFANDEAFYEQFVQALKESDERGGRLPRAQEYRDSLKSNSADLKNVGKGSGGASVAACFLQEFIEEPVAWIHLDIAGVADKEESGATGAMVRTMANLCRNK